MDQYGASIDSAGIGQAESNFVRPIDLSTLVIPGQSTKASKPLHATTPQSSKRAHPAAVATHR